MPALSALVDATPFWPTIRPLLAVVSLVAPTTCAPMAAAFTGVQRPHPEFATRARSVGSDTSELAPLRPTAPISDPPNQAARPTSCMVRASVLVELIGLESPRGVEVQGVLLCMPDRGGG